MGGLAPGVGGLVPGVGGLVPGVGGVPGEEEEGGGGGSLAGVGVVLGQDRLEENLSGVPWGDAGKA